MTPKVLWIAIVLLCVHYTSITCGDKQDQQIPSEVIDFETEKALEVKENPQESHNSGAVHTGPVLEQKGEKCKFQDGDDTYQDGTLMGTGQEHLRDLIKVSEEIMEQIPDQEDRTIVTSQHERNDKNPEISTSKPPQSTKVVLQAFGAFSDDSDVDVEIRQKKDEEEGDIWTEQTEEGTEQKRTGGRRFFSLMNLIKFLLNPVIEEFQEIEKASSNSGSDSTAVTSDVSSTVISKNSSDLTDLSTANSSQLADKDEKKNGTDSGKKTKFQCVGRNVTENTTATVQVVNSTILLELLSFDKNNTTADCVLVMFYAPWCHFCAATAAHYNAIARAFPQLEVLAVDTVHFSNLNARFGTVAVPNIMLFHQSRSAVRFNHTERHFQTLLQFITNTTGLEANNSVELSPEDYVGPLSSVPTEETDYLLWFAWLFIILCSGYIFIYSQAGQRALERLHVLWQEHQHQHIE